MANDPPAVPPVPDLGLSLSRREAMSQAIRTGTLRELPWAAPRAVVEIPPGTLLDGRYEVGAPVGTGGYGRVFDGRDTLTDKRVAIKVLERLTELRRRRMHEEVEVLRRLDLPCVVEFVDEGDLEGERPYVVMPFEEGDRFPGSDHDGTWARLGPRVLALAEALARVHAAGVLHRDLKPDNVLWVEGTPVLLDFGLARSEGLRFEPGDDIEGSPAYLAPEQYLGEPPTERSDLFSLGVLLYESLAGMLPFPGTATMDIVTQLLTQDPVPLCERADVPEEVGQLIGALLAKDPAERLPTAANLVRALRPLVPEPAGLPDGLGGATPADLERGFVGPELVHHLRSDPARVLWRRTGGREDRVRRTLAAWVRAGVAAPAEKGRIRVSREAADRLAAGLLVDPCRDGSDPRGLSDELVTLWNAVELLAPWADLERLGTVVGMAGAIVEERLAALADRGLVAHGEDEGAWFSMQNPPRLDGALYYRLVDRIADAVPRDSNERLRHLVAAGRTADLPEAGLAVARARRLDGRQQEAWVAARAAMVAERRMGRPGHDALTLAAELALEASMRGEMRVVELEAQRRGLEAVAELMGFGRRVLQGPKEVSEPQGLGERLPPALAKWPDTLKAHLLQLRSIDEHAAWVEHRRGTVPQSQWAAWASRLEMRRGELLHAAELAEQARTGLQGVRWVAATLNTASLWLDAGDFERAAQRLSEVAPSLAHMRTGLLEAFAYSMWRGLAYRRGEAVGPDDAFMESLDHLDAPRMAGPGWFLDAAAAWRRGDSVRAMAGIGRIQARLPTSTPVRLMADALAPLALPSHPRTDDVRERASNPSIPPGLRLQVVAMDVAAGGTIEGSEADGLLRELAGLRYPPAARRELFSAEEMTAILEGRAWER